MKRTITVALICAVLMFGTMAAGQAIQSPGPQISFERAIEIAIERVGGGVVIEIELDRERGVLVYEVEIRHDMREHDIRIDANTGETIRHRHFAQVRQYPDPQISHVRAMEIAIERVGGGMVTELKLDRERGVLVYDVEIRHEMREHDVRIDANTGEIIRYGYGH